MKSAERRKLTRKNESIAASHVRREAKVVLILSLLSWNMRMQRMFPMNPKSVTKEVSTPTTQNSKQELNSDMSLIIVKFLTFSSF